MIPIFEIKLIVAIVSVWLLLRKHIVSKKYIFLSLVLIYSLTFIYSPYWHVFHTLPVLKYVLLISLFLSGLVWAKVVSADIKLPKVNLGLAYPIALAGFLYLIVFKAISSDIAWRGDEDFHFRLLLDLISYFNFWWGSRSIYLFNNPLLWLFGLLFGSMIVFRLWRHRRAFRALCLILIPFTAALFYPTYVFKNPGNPLILSDVLRYPYFQKWLNLLYIFPNFYQDIKLYRAVPLLSLIFISWYLFFQIQKKIKSKLLSGLCALVLSTIPLLLFYSTLLYLELPLILVLLIVTFNLKPLVFSSQAKLKTYPAWYALLLIGFLKETGLILVVLFFLLRILFRLKKSLKVRNFTLILNSELKLGIEATFPGLLFLGFRYIFSGYHPYEFHLQNLLVVNNFIGTARSLFSQTGILSMIAVMGLFCLFTKGDKPIFVSVVTIFLGTLAFFLSYVLLDFTNSTQGIVYVGYSRWLLYLLPVLLYLGVYFLTLVKWPLLLLMLSSLFIFNMRYLPFATDGTRKPNWGSGGVVDVGEYTYPYGQAIHFLAQNSSRDILYTGNYSPYSGFRFYFFKYNFFPKVWEYPFGNRRFDAQTERVYVTSFFEELSKGSLEPRLINVDAILYHSVNNIDPKSIDIPSNPYRLVRVISNYYHSLFIFFKVDMVEE